MPQFLCITTPLQTPQFVADESLPSFDASQLVEHAPDAHWQSLEDGRILARCSLWWRHTPPYPGHRLGLIGHYATTDAAVGQSLLDHACRQLQAQGCTLAVAPLDGSTWRSYRLVTERGSEPPFFMEPDHPDHWPHHFRHCGFAPLADYSSMLNTDLSYRNPRTERVAARMEALGVTIRPFDRAEPVAELHRLFTVAAISFRGSFLYTPLEEAEFTALYSKLLPLVVPDLLLLALHGDRPVGFIFAVPDYLQQQRRETITTVVIKTLAVLPGRAYAGLGSLLADRCHRTARELGYIRAIHALMHDANNSRNLSGRYAGVMRRYTLFARPLA